MELLKCSDFSLFIHSNQNEKDYVQNSRHFGSIFSETNWPTEEKQTERTLKSDSSLGNFPHDLSFLSSHEHKVSSEVLGQGSWKLVTGRALELVYGSLDKNHKVLTSLTPF